MLPFLNLKSGLVVWAIAGPVLAGGVVYLAMLAREAIVTSGAVRIARGEEVVRCNAQRAAIATTMNRATKKAVDAAWDAASEIDVPADIAALCKASASCRDRGKP